MSDIHWIRTRGSERNHIGIKVQQTTIEGRGLPEGASPGQGWFTLAPLCGVQHRDPFKDVSEVHQDDGPCSNCLEVVADLTLVLS